VSMFVWSAATRIYLALGAADEAYAAASKARSDQDQRPRLRPVASFRAPPEARWYNTGHYQP